MADPLQLPPGHVACGSLTALNSTLLSRSRPPSLDYPVAFMAEQLALARSTLRLCFQELPDFSSDTLSGTIRSESTTITLLTQLVKGLVTVSLWLSGVTQRLATISEEYEAIREELHHVSSQLTNLPAANDQQPPPPPDTHRPSGVDP